VTKTLASLTMLVVCSVAGTHTAHAANKKNISGSGCVEKAIENSCRVVIDSQTGDLYNLQFTARAPQSGTAIRFSGRPHKGATACKQGKLVTVSRWKEEKGIKCPPPVVMAEAGR
jgi:hypothetical protein